MILEEIGSAILVSLILAKGSEEENPLDIKIKAMAKEKPPITNTEEPIKEKSPPRGTLTTI